MAKRRHIIERVEDMSPEQREPFAFGVRAADHTRRTRAVDRFVRDLPADQRQAMIAELEAIESAPDCLRRIAEWMGTSNDQRAARAGEVDRE